jgi:hypothetical protein
MPSCWGGTVSVGQGGYMAVVGRRDIDAQDWQLAKAAVVSEREQAFYLGNRLRLYGVCRGPSSQPVAIAAYDESVH